MTPPNGNEARGGRGPSRRGFRARRPGFGHRAGSPCRRSSRDKIVQGTAAEVLSTRLRGRFLGCSYGFRPGEEPHTWLLMPCMRPSSDSWMPEWDDRDIRAETAAEGVALSLPGRNRRDRLLTAPQPRPEPVVAAGRLSPRAAPTDSHHQRRLSLRAKLPGLSARATTGRRVCAGSWSPTMRPRGCSGGITLAMAEGSYVRELSKASKQEFLAFDHRAHSRHRAVDTLARLEYSQPSPRSILHADAVAGGPGMR